MAVKLAFERLSLAGGRPVVVAEARYDAPRMGQHRMSVRWTWAAAKAIGTAHMQVGLPCQDAFACHVATPSPETEVLIAALADGAGSAERAEAGARLATSIFVDVGARVISMRAVRRLRKRASLSVLAPRRPAARLRRSRATKIARSRTLQPRLWWRSCTPSGGAVGQVGDGGVVAAEGADHCWRPVLWPDHGEYVNTTSFLTDTDALEQFRVESLQSPVASVCLFSDGLERLVLDFRARTAHAPFFDTLFKSFDGGPRSGPGRCRLLRPDRAAGVGGHQSAHR